MLPNSFGSRDIERGNERMKLVVFNEGRPGLLTERGLVDVSKLVAPLGRRSGSLARITHCLEPRDARGPIDRHRAFAERLRIAVH